MPVQAGQIVQDIQQAQQTPERTYITPSEGADFSGVSKAFESFGKTLSSGQGGSQKKTYDFLYDGTDKLRDKFYAKYNEGSSVINADLQRDIDAYYKTMGQYYTPSEIEGALEAKGVKALSKPIVTHNEALAAGQEEEYNLAKDLGQIATGSNDATLNVKAGQALIMASSNGLRSLTQAGSSNDTETQNSIVDNPSNSYNFSTLINTDLQNAVMQQGGFLNSQQFDSWKLEYARNMSQITGLPLQATTMLTEKYTGWYKERAAESAKATGETAKEVSDMLGIMTDSKVIAKFNQVIKTPSGNFTYGDLVAQGKVTPELMTAFFSMNPDVAKAVVTNFGDLGVNAPNIKDVIGTDGTVGKLLRNAKTAEEKAGIQGKAGEMQDEVNEAQERAALEESWKVSGETPEALNTAMRTYINTTSGTAKNDWLDKDKELQIFQRTAMAQGQANNKLYEGSWWYSSEGGLVQIDPETGVPHLLTMEGGVLKERTWTDLTNQANKTFVQTQMKLIPQFIDASATRTGKSRQELAQIFNNAMIATSDAAIARMRRGGSANLQDFQGMLERDRTSTLPEANRMSESGRFQIAQEELNERVSTAVGEGVEEIRSRARQNAREGRALLESLGLAQKTPRADLRDALTKLDTNETRRGDDGGAPALSMPSTQVTTPKPNTTVASPAEGVVTYKGSFKGYGNMLVITEGDRNWILYGDGTETLSDIEQNSRINEGDPIFRTNSKGNMYIMLAQNTGKGKVKYLNAEEILQPRA